MKTFFFIIVGTLLSISMGCSSSSSDNSDKQEVDTISISTNAGLIALEISAAPLNQVFQTTINSYTASVSFSTTTTTITAIASEVSATITVNENPINSSETSSPIALTVGTNNIVLLVTAEDGISQQTYNVTIIRSPASTNANLTALHISTGTLDQTFQSNVNSYTSTSGYITTTITITATTADENAVLTVNSVAANSGEKSTEVVLTEGSTTITVVVTAEDDVTQNIYSIDVTRQSVSSFAQQAYIKASNPDPDDRFGRSVALSGNTLAVGAYFEDSDATGINGNQGDGSISTSDSGAVYIFTRNAGTWTQQAYIKASNTDINDQFGGSVALSGDTLVVGALFEDSNATGINGAQGDGTGLTNGSGAVYVFTRTGITWSQQAYIKASNTGANDHFGNAVAISGDTLAVGSVDEDSDATGINGNQGDGAGLTNDSGAVYVFTRTGITWTQQAYIKASNTGEKDQFGVAIDLFGDTLVVGASKEDSDSAGVNQPDNNNGFDNGAVYVFTRDGNTWSQEAFLKASNSGSGDNFGSAIAISQDTVAVGAKFDNSDATGVNGNQGNGTGLTDDSGAVYIFTRTESTWEQQAYIKASNTGSDDRFGGTVALDGETLAVGARFEDSDTIGLNGTDNDNFSNAGAVYVFTRDAGLWSQKIYVKPHNSGVGDQFGYSVALSNGTLAVGALFEDSDSMTINGVDNDNISASGAAYTLQ